MKVIFKIVILLVFIFVIIEEISSCHTKRKRTTTSTTTRQTSTTTTRINDGSGNIDPRVGNPGSQGDQTTTGFAFQPIKWNCKNMKKKY